MCFDTILKAFRSSSANTTTQAQATTEPLEEFHISETMSLSGKVAIVTGGSKGIGRATVLKLAEEGAKVVVNYGRDSAAADELVAQLGADRALAVQADAGSVEGVRALVQRTVDAYGKIDILVNNAGVLPMKDLAATSETDFDATYGLNVKGPYFLTQAAVPHMAPGSRVVFLSTTVNHASTVQPGYLLYCSTKGAVEQMTRVLAKDLGRKGIRVNCVAPGPTATELFLRNQNEQSIKMIKGFNPFNEIGKPEDIADTIVFLSGEGSKWVSGQVIKVNGAMA